MRLITGIAVVAMFGNLMLGGCDLNKPDSAGLAVAEEAPSPSGQAYLNKTAVRDENGKQTDNAVDAAMEWARKYAEVSSKRDQLLQENRLLTRKQQAHQQEVAKLKNELARAENELAQANTMLVEMKRELEKWKTSVLGFRDEMRQSQKAQLDALVRILTLIGGEVVEKPLTTKPVTPTTGSGDKEKTGGAS